DAYLLLAEDCADAIARADLCRQAVDAGWRALDRDLSAPGRGGEASQPPGVAPWGKEPAPSHLGHGADSRGPYWLRLETRPYMRARFDLAEALAEVGLLREAASHLWALCALNPQDQQGARHRLAELLLKVDDEASLRRLLAAYADERAPAFFPYTCALVAYRRGDRADAEALIDEALVLNPHVPAFLSGDRSIPDVAPERFILGDEAEAATYALGTHGSWRATPGALRWLAEAAARVSREAAFVSHDASEARVGPCLVAEGNPMPKDAMSKDAMPKVEIPYTPPHLVTVASNEGQKRDDVWAIDASKGDPEADSPDDRGAEVARLLVAALADEDEDEEFPLVDHALAVWADFLASEAPSIRKPAVYAAAVEYVVSRLFGQPRYTQGEIARRYGVAPSSVSRVTQALNTWIDQTLSLARIGDPDDPDDLDDLDESGDPASDGTALPALDDETLRELKALPRGDESWSGALRAVPFQVLEPRPHRPTLAVWYDAAHEKILGQNLYSPTVPERALVDTLLRAFYAPNVGEPRLPRAVRVEDSRLAAHLKRELAPLDIDVETGSLEGIDDLMASLEGYLQRKTEASYLGPDIDASEVAQFFAAAATLRRAASWTFVSEGQVLGVDLDRWGLGRVCVSVIGATGYDRGLLIFRELDDYLRHFRYTAMSDLDGALVGSPVEILSLFFEQGAELEPSQRREVFKHGWEVVGPDDYPVLFRTDGEGGLIDLDGDDYRVATICAEAAARFCEHNSRLFVGEGRGPLRERIDLEHSDLDGVYVVAPHPIS
ncbi:MAG: hypothetical protein KAI47_25025, partial [Deltaproteobacteria bacterium]|nr:hypothetical protein [Deltaproteobacteria bacterium]